MGSDLEPGDPARIGPYRLVGVLGTGGMGRVFLGRSAGGRPVAVKVIRAELASDSEFRTRFRREVAAARQVSGLYTALVVDADVDGQIPWLATAYVPGPSLAYAVASQGPLPLASLLVLAAGLAEGLGAIHTVGLVHRDLKPSNVLLANDGPRVIDFGISRAVEATAMTHTGLVIGSPGFMSPEQAEGGEVGPASDVFSLGAVLTFAATGHGPFGTGSTAALIYRIVHGLPQLDDAPAEIRALAERCLAKDPAQRPTAADILVEFGDAEPAANWLPETIVKELPRHSLAALTASAAPAPLFTETPVPAESETSGDSPGIRPSSATTDAPMTAPDSAPGPASARPAQSHVPGAALAQDRVPPTVTVAGAAPSPSAFPAPSVSPAPQSPPRGGRIKRRIWLAAAAMVVAVAAAVLLVLTALPSSQGSGDAPVVGVYSGSQYGISDPQGMAIGSGDVWVTNSATNSVTELDADTGAWVRTLSGSQYGFKVPIGITDDGTHVWVANFNGNSVTELNASNGSLVHTLDGDTYAFYFPSAVMADGDKLWVLNAYSVTELNASDGSLVRTLSSGIYRFDGPSGLATDGPDIWVTNYAGDTVTELNSSSGNLVRIISGSTYGFKGPAAIVVDRTHVWVENAKGNSITELNASDGTLVRIISGSKYGFDQLQDVAADGTHIWVVNSGRNSVTELDAATGAWVQTLSGGNYHFYIPFSIAVSGTHAWVTNWGNANDGSVTEFTTS